MPASNRLAPAKTESLQRVKQNVPVDTGCCLKSHVHADKVHPPVTDSRQRDISVGRWTKMWIMEHENAHQIPTPDMVLADMTSSRKSRRPPLLVRLPSSSRVV